MKRNPISVFIDEDTGSEFSKLPRRIQKLINKILDAEATYDNDNLPGDNHVEGYSFD